MAGLFNSTLADLLKKFSDTFDIKGQTPFYQDPGAASVGVTTPVERTDLNFSEYTSVPGAAREYEKWSQGNYPLTYSSNPMNEVDPSVGLGIKQGRLSDTIDAAMLPADALGIASMFKAPVKATARILVPEAAERLDRIVPKFAIKEPSLEPNRIPAPRDDYGFYSAVEEEALNLKRKSGNGQAYINDFLKGQNVKKEEMDWIGLTDWLKEKKNVTKEEIQEFVANNKINLFEVQRGEYQLKAPFTGNIVSNKWRSALPNTFDVIDRLIKTNDSKLEDIYNIWSYEASRGLGDPVYPTAQLYPQMNLYNRVYDEITNYLINNKEFFPEIEQWTQQVNFPLTPEAIKQFAPAEFKVQLQKRAIDFINKVEEETFKDVDLKRRAFDLANSRTRNKYVGKPKFSEFTERNSTKINNKETVLGIAEYKDRELANSWTDANAKRYSELKNLQEDEFTGKTDMSQAEYDELMTLSLKKEAIEENTGYKFDSHYPEKNYFAHWRTNDRVNSEGEPFRFVEEVQYDWGQRGAKSGFGDFVTLRKTSPDTFDFIDIKTGRIVDTFKGKTNEAWNKVKDLNQGTVGSNPFFKTQQKTTLKRIIQQSIEEGVDTLGFSPASIQQKRWGTAIPIKEIRIHPTQQTIKVLENPKFKNVTKNWTKPVETAFELEFLPKTPLNPSLSDHKYVKLYVDKNGKILNPTDPWRGQNQFSIELEGKHLKNVVPEEIAEKILNNYTSNKFKDHRFLTDFKLGGKGFDVEYDIKNPSILNELGKEYGAEVTTKYKDKYGSLLTKLEDHNYSIEDFEEMSIYDSEVIGLGIDKSLVPIDGNKILKRIKEDNNGKFPEWLLKKDIEFLEIFNETSEALSAGPSSKWKSKYFEFKIPKTMADTLTRKGQPLFSAAPAASLLQQEDEEDIFNNPLMREPFDITLP